MLAASLVGGGASAGARRFSHEASLGVNLVASGWVAIATTRRVGKRRGSSWNRYGPSALVWASVALLCADPVRHVLQDEGLWTRGSRMYRDGCEHADARCLSVVGWIFLMCTYLGFACLVVGAVWNADAFGKLGREWSRRRRDADADASSADEETSRLSA